MMPATAEQRRRQQEAAVDQHGVVAAAGHAGRQAARRDDQVDHAGDSAGGCCRGTCTARRSRETSRSSGSASRTSPSGWSAIAAQRYRGHAARSLAALDDSVSGRTRTSATVVMKFVSPFQRGRTWTWRCAGTPAPAGAPEVHARR